MKQRVITAIILFLVFTPLFIIEELFVGFIILMVLMAGYAAYELLNMFNKESKIHIVPFVTTIVLTIIVFLNSALSMSKQLGLEKYDMINFNINFEFSVLVVVLVLLSMMVLITSYSGKQIGKSFTTIFYIGMAVSSITTLRMMGVRFIIYLFLVTSLTDIFAYAFGMRFGKHKMSPKISPKKSWEGAIAGTVIATILGSLFAIFYDGFPAYFNPNHDMTLFATFTSLGELSRVVQAPIIVGITLVASVLGQIGDLVASKFKRTYEIKDFSNIFPGHGGVLDRFDSTLFVSMFLVLVFISIQAIFPV